MLKGFLFYYNNDDDYDENGVTINTDRGHHTTTILYNKTTILYNKTVIIYKNYNYLQKLLSSNIYRVTY